MTSSRRINICPSHRNGSAFPSPQINNLISGHVMEISGDEIAAVVLKEFETWPSKRKPLDRGHGVKEWVPLAGIVVEGWI